MALFEQQLHYPLKQLAAGLERTLFKRPGCIDHPSGYYRNLLDKEGNNALMQWMSKGGRV